MKNSKKIFNPFENQNKQDVWNKLRTSIDSPMNREDAMKQIEELTKKTYDVIFNDDNASNSKGFKETLEYCKNYIEKNNGTNASYFSDYKGGNISIVCNETSEVVFTTKVK